MKAALRNLHDFHPSQSPRHRPATIHTTDFHIHDKNPQFAFHSHPLHDTKRFDHYPTPTIIRKSILYQDPQ